MLVTSNLSMISSLRSGLGLRLSCLRLRSSRLFSSSGSSSFLSRTELSELRLVLRSRSLFGSGGSAKISSPPGTALGLPPLRRLSSSECDGRCPDGSIRPRPLGSLFGGTFSGRSEDPLTGCGGARRGDADLSLISSLSNSSLVLSVAVFLAGDAGLPFGTACAM